MEVSQIISVILIPLQLLMWRDLQRRCELIAAEHRSTRERLIVVETRAGITPHKG